MKTIFLPPKREATKGDQSPQVTPMNADFKSWIGVRRFRFLICENPRNLRIAVFVFLGVFVSLWLNAATVLIPLETCGLNPAAGRNFTLTPLQAAGNNTIPVMDRIQTNTDGSGNCWVTLLPGVYQADVRPAWGQVGTTEFQFYVDPSNAVQDAFTNLLTGTNNTWPPNQYAWSAQASDARYLQAAAIANAVTNTEPGVNLSGTFSGNGSGLTNVNAGMLGGIGANSLNSAFGAIWMTNYFLEWWSADTINTNNNSLVTNWIGRNGVILAGNAWYVTQAINGHPAVYFDGTGNNIFTNGSILGGISSPGVCTNSCTIFCVYRQPQTAVNFTSSKNIVIDGMVANGTLRAWFSAATANSPINMTPPEFVSYYPGANQAFQDAANYNLTDDTRVYCATWSETNFQDYFDGKIFQNYPIAEYDNGGTAWPVGFSGNLALGQLFNHGWPFNGYIAEFLIYTTQLPSQTIDQINNYLLAKYGLLRNNIIFFGDSMVWGGDSSYPGGWSFMVSSNFPNWSIDNEGVPGATSSQVLSNVIAAAGSSCSTKKVAAIWCNLQNGNESISTITNNIIEMSQVLWSNNWITILVDPPSNYFTDTNQIAPGGEPIRFAFQNIFTNCWPQFFNGFIDLARDPDVGPSNAWKNTVYYPTAGVGEHWTNAAYLETAPYVVSVIHSVSDGFYFVASTNAPPPTIGQPWTCVTTNHSYYNSNGVWALIH